jgi:hypothetical protein
MNNLLNKFKELLTNDKVAKGKAFVVKYKNYIGACALFLVMVLVLCIATGPDAITKRMDRINNKTVSGEDYVPDKEFAIDAYPELNELIKNYFDAYVNADFDKLESLATPVSKMEKSYITVMSQYYESYENVVCYSKHGLSRNSYIVSACFDIKFKDQGTMAPSMVLFYVQTNADGTLYINNLYSDFNMKYSETPVNRDVYTGLRKYTTQSDYLELYNKVEKAFSSLIKENNEIYQLTKRTIPSVRQEWEDTVFYVPSTEDTEDSTGTEDTSSTEEIEDTETQGTEDSADTESEKQEPESEAPVVVKVRATDDVNIRSTMSTANYDNVIRTSTVGEIFVKLGEEDGWTKVQLEDGAVGYINSRYVETVTE